MTSTKARSNPTVVRQWQEDGGLESTYVDVGDDDVNTIKAWRNGTGHLIVRFRHTQVMIVSDDAEDALRQALESVPWPIPDMCRYGACERECLPEYDYCGEHLDHLDAVSDRIARGAAL